MTIFLWLNAMLSILPRRWKAVANFFNLWPDLPMHGSCPRRLREQLPNHRTHGKNHQQFLHGFIVHVQGARLTPVVAISYRYQTCGCLTHLQRGDFFSRFQDVQLQLQMSFVLLNFSAIQSCVHQGPVGN